MTFFNRKADTSSGAYPNSASTSSVCSPSSGERVTWVGLSLILMGLPTVKYLPRLGGSTSPGGPGVRSDGSFASSSIHKIGPQGTSCSLSKSIASNLVLVEVHASPAANTSFNLGKRALGVAKSGSVIQDSLPMTWQMSFHTGA